VVDSCDSVLVGITGATTTLHVPWFMPGPTKRQS
jgi:hypothetical protein